MADTITLRTSTDRDVIKIVERGPQGPAGGGGGGGSGTVTSVALASTDLTITGSPITTSGTITANIAANAVTLEKLQTISSEHLLGRHGSGNGGVQQVGLGTGLTMTGSNVAVTYGTTAGTACQGNDSRLSDARTPTAHTHVVADVTDLSLNKVPEARQTYNITSTNSGSPTQVDAQSAFQNVSGSIDCVVVLNNTTGIVYANIVVPDLLNAPGSQRGRVIIEATTSGSGDITNFRIDAEGTIVYPIAGYEEILPSKRLVFVWTGNNWNLECLHTASTPVQIYLPNAAGTLALTSDITKSAVGLGNVTNNAQTQAAIVPNTAPSAGQLLVGNAGGTAYAPVSVSGDATLSSTGVFTLANTTTARTNLGITQLPAKVDVFTSSGTWTKPAGAKMVHYVLVGGGGGGGGGRRSNSTTAAYGGGGGSGGGVSVGWLNADFLGATETVTIGAGGSGGSARTASDTNGADGVAGNTTSFTAYLEARGGAQGSGGTTTTGTRGAATAARGAFYGGTQDAMAGGGAGSPETTGGTGENRMSMPSGGGGGAGKSAAGAYGTGGASAAIGLSGTGSRTGISATANAAGTNGTGFFYYGLGGSGGSPNSTTGAANKGGDGGLYGAGGGGGAGSLNAAGGDNSGGAGANGVAVITTYF